MLKSQHCLTFIFQNKSLPFLCLGFDECGCIDASDGLQTHQLCASEDDDDTTHRFALQGGLPSAVLPVSTHAVHLLTVVKRLTFLTPV